VIIFEGQQIPSNPCKCGNNFIETQRDSRSRQIRLVCPYCLLAWTVLEESLYHPMDLACIWRGVVQNAQFEDAQFHQRRTAPQNTPPPRPEPRPELRQTPPTSQPFGVRHNLPPPKPTPPPPEPPIKEVQREYDRYELLELDKNTSQKELTFEGCWFTCIELS
jgi:hypothetical protein